jgi:hypothetical protein
MQNEQIALDPLAISLPALDQLLQRSLTEKKGLAIFIGDHILHAIFVAQRDANTLELRSQAFERLLVRIDRIDAIAIS